MCFIRCTRMTFQISRMALADVKCSGPIGRLGGMQDRHETTSVSLPQIRDKIFLHNMHKHNVPKHLLEDLRSVQEDLGNVYVRCFIHFYPHAKCLWTVAVWRSWTCPPRPTISMPCADSSIEISGPSAFISSASQRVTLSFGTMIIEC